MLRRPPSAAPLSLHDALPISAISCASGISVTAVSATSTARSRASTSEAPITRWPGLASMQRRTSRSEEHTSELQSHSDLVCRLLLEKKKKRDDVIHGKTELKD